MFMSFRIANAVTVGLLVIYGTIAVVKSTNATLWQNPWSKKSIDCQRTNWMHTAKTASTFCLSLQHVCCPAQFQKLTYGVTMDMLSHDFSSQSNAETSDYRFESHYCYKFHRKGYASMNCSFTGRPEHIPLSPSIDLLQHMGLMVMREPKSRIISAFLDGIHLEGFVNRSLGHEMRNKFHEMDLDTSTPRLQRLLTKARIYTSHNMLYGHQVKMLLGVPTIDLSVRNETMMMQVVDLAVRRMSEFYFVGLFDQYARSLHLFHALADQGTTPTDVELFPRRSTDTADKAYLMKHIDYDDPCDTLLYQAAQKIFQEEIDFVKKWKGINI